MAQFVGVICTVFSNSLAINCKRLELFVQLNIQKETF
jgi:hypothetical protein